MRRSGVIVRSLSSGLFTLLLAQAVLAAPAKRDGGGIATANKPPVANPDSAQTSYETPITLKTQSNDTDPDGDRLSISAAGAAAHGSTRLGRSGITYTPPAGFSGTDSFSYTVSDGRGGTSTAMVTITVAAKPNAAPVANADRASTAYQTAVTVNLLDNDSDPDGDTLIITANTSAAKGTVTRSGGSATYTPAAGFSGTDSFSYTLSDGNGGTANATVSVSVAPKPNSAPVTGADTASTTSPDAVTINLLGNDSDPDGDTLTVTSNTNPANGSVSRSGSSATYTPAAGFSGTDSFGYTVSDGNGGTATGTVTISVASKPNTAPVANADSANTAFGMAVTVDLLGNDTDPDGDMLIITANTSAANGTVTRSGGSATYTPATGFSGSDSFSYTLSDGNGGTATGVVTVSVSQPPNAAPVARADSASARAGQQTTVDLVSNDYDPDGDALSVVVVNPPIGGTATLAGGTLSYTPRPEFQGDDSFSYTISDGKGGSSSAVVTVRVEAAPTESSPSTVLRTGSASLSWTIPTTRADGSPIPMSELGGYEIYLLAESTGESRVITLADPGATSYTVDGLLPDVYHFSMAASDSAGNLSELSEIVSKTVSP